MTELDPRTLFERLLRFWWVLVVGTLVGGTAGWIFSRLQSPQYEATAHYQVDIDEQGLLDRLGLSDPDELDFVTVNPYLTPVADAFYTPDIREQVLASLSAEGIQLAAEDFNTRTFILDRRGYLWFVTVRAEDPDQAIRMADLWVETVDGRLHEFLAHAVAAQALQLQYSLILRCFETNAFQEANQCAGTTFASLSDLDSSLAFLAEQITMEQAEAGGLDPLLSFRIERTAEATPAPMLFARASLLAAGGMLGFLLALLLVLFNVRSMFPVK